MEVIKEVIVEKIVCVDRYKDRNEKASNCDDKAEGWYRKNHGANSGELKFFKQGHPENNSEWKFVGRGNPKK